MFTPLTHFAVKYVRDIDDAKGIVHDAFVALWEKYPTLTDTNLKSYLFTSVKNRCLNHLRSKKKIVALDTIADHAASPDNDTLGLEELERGIETALNNLPEKCREAFELSRGEGLKYAEIAERMGISVKTVEAHMTKALTLLREHLGKFLTVIFFIFYFILG